MKKLNFLIRLSFIVALVAIMVTSCQKSDISPVQAQETTKKTSLTSLEAGVVHNAALDYLAANVNLSQATGQQMFEVITDYFLNNTQSQDVQKELIDLRDGNTPISTPIVTNISNWISQNQSTLTPIEINYFLQAENELNKYAQQGVVVAAAGIRSVQNNVLSDVNLDELTKNKLSGSFSILANSLEYWDDANHNLNNPWNPQNVTVSSVPHKLLPSGIIIKTVTVDAMAYGLADQTERDDEACLLLAAKASMDFFILFL